ncbi:MULTISPECIES: hypothetical protein [unclassified Streptomyces]|uniref:hypothetical protein n=1 Tax=unclassified Streptomyces TaxID=2593676 RepID=UPI00380B2F9F
MPEHLSTHQLAGVTAFAVVCAAWLTGLRRAARRGRAGTRSGKRAAVVTPALPVVPRQRGAGPHREAVALTPAERAAFERLVRRLGGRP